jgi:hypothetical protein
MLYPVRIYLRPTDGYTISGYMQHVKAAIVPIECFVGVVRGTRLNTAVIAMSGDSPAAALDAAITLFRAAGLDVYKGEVGMQAMGAPTP